MTTSTNSTFEEEIAAQDDELMPFERVDFPCPSCGCNVRTFHADEPRTTGPRRRCFNPKCQTRNTFGWLEFKACPVIHIGDSCDVVDRRAEREEWDRINARRDWAEQHS